MNDHVIAALVLRRRTMSGEIATLQGQIQQLHADLASLDSVIRQIDPDYPLDALRPRYRRAPTPGEYGAMSRTVLDVLRRATAPMSAKEIAAKVIAERGLNTGDRALTRAMNKRVDMALRYQRTNGMVCEAEKNGAVGWEIGG